MRALALAIPALLLASPALGGTIVAELDSDRIEVGRATTLRVEVRGGSASRPTLSTPPGLSVNEVSVIKRDALSRGTIVIVHQYTFQVTGLKVGKATLGPVRVEVDGQSKVSRTFEVEVVAASGRRSGRTSGRTSRAGPDNVRGAAPKGQRGGDYYSVADLSDDRPFVGEVFMYDVEVGAFLQTRGRIEWQRPKGFEALATEPGVDEAKGESRRIIDSRHYEVDTVRLALYAMEAGPVSLDPSKFTMTVVRGGGRRSIGRREAVTFESEALSLRVRPLPDRGRPEGFDGPVGRFGVEATMDQAELETGGTATLTVTVRGLGSLRAMEVDIEVPDGLRIYDEQPIVTSHIAEDGLRTKALYHKAIVPLEPGTFVLPPVELSFFDPEDERYRVAKSEPLTLHVTGEPIIDAAVVARSSALTTAKEQVEVLGTDILPLHSGPRMLGDSRIRITSPLILALLLLPILGLGGVGTRVGRLRLAGTEGGQRRARGRAAKDAGTDARRAAKSDDLEASEQALRSYLTARLERSGAALSPHDGPDVARTGGAPDDLADHLGRLLGQLEAARYGGASATGLTRAIADWISDAERSWR